MWECSPKAKFPPGCKCQDRPFCIAGKADANWYFSCTQFCTGLADLAMIKDALNHETPANPWSVNFLSPHIRVAAAGLLLLGARGCAWRATWAGRAWGPAPLARAGPPAPQHPVQGTLKDQPRNPVPWCSILHSPVRRWCEVLLTAHTELPPVSLTGVAEASSPWAPHPLVAPRAPDLLTNDY